MARFMRRRSTNDSTFSSAETVVDGGSNFDAAHPADEYGIRVLYEPESKRAVVDIVLVHGLHGHPERTWTARGATGPWPKEMLPQIFPNARVMSFGYASAVVDLAGTSSQFSENRINDHARNLLSALSAARTHDASISRPIIFLAHSLGGLICQDALIHSKQSPEAHLATIEQCTLAIAFLGTPHSGSALAKWAERLSQSLGLLGLQTNRSIARVLRHDSEILVRIQDHFQSVLRRRESSHKIEVTCFYEEEPVPGVGVVVPRSSATLPGYHAIGIKADHREMARFSSTSSPGFSSVVGELQRWVAKAERKAAAVEEERRKQQQQQQQQRQQAVPATTALFVNTDAPARPGIYVHTAHSSVIAANIVIGELVMR